MYLQTVESALDWLASVFQKSTGFEMPRHQARLLVSHATGVPFNTLSDSLSRQLNSWEKRIIEGYVKYNLSTPVPIFVGYTYVSGIKILTTKDALLPGTETERLIDFCIDLMQTHGATRILELGTGSGVIATLLALQFPHIEIYATDISPAAIKLTERNLDLHGVTKQVHLLVGDWFNPIDAYSPELVFDLIVANPPYLSKKEISEMSNTMASVTPIEAVYGGPSGLDNHSLIANSAADYLKEGGYIVLQTNQGQAETVAACLAKANKFADVRMARGSSNSARIVCAIREPSQGGQ